MIKPVQVDVLFGGQVRFDIPDEYLKLDFWLNIDGKAYYKNKDFKIIANNQIELVKKDAVVRSSEVFFTVV